jgi:hypothetical protein
MEFLAQNLPALWRDLCFPLLRLLLFMSCGLLLAFFLETMRWTKFLARFSSPLAHFGHMGECSSAAFSLAFFSPAAANALLSENYQKGQIKKNELIFSCLLNSSPAFFVHLPSAAVMVFSFLGAQGLLYLGITFAASLLRTLCTALCGHILLPARKKLPGKTGKPAVPAQAQAKPIAAEIWQRFKFRLRNILLFTIPAYILFFIIQKLGWFEALSNFLAANSTVSFPVFLRPEAVSIVALSLTSEMGAALSAASALMLSGALSMQEITLALLTGNILSTPIRALRHQVPSYAGFYAPRLAFQLVLINQGARALSMVFLTCLYYIYNLWLC